MAREKLSALAVMEVESPSELADCYEKIDLFTFPNFNGRKYIVGLAGSRRVVEDILRLRYRVFNIELGEGLAASKVTGMDEDRFDRQMHHLVLLDKESGIPVGTYRLQTIQQAFAVEDIYSAQEFDISGLRQYFGRMVELGRACLSPEHRKFSAIMHLWQGIGAFMNLHGCRYLIGCCSITSADPDDGWRAMKTIRTGNHLHQDLLLPSTDKYNCGPASRELEPDLGDPIPLPHLFRAYLKIGAKVISEPALDREFGTVDFLLLLDGYEVKKSSLDVLD